MLYAVFFFFVDKMLYAVDLNDLAPTSGHSQ